MTALITVFSTLKPFINPHIAMIQNNAISSWLHLGEDVDPILIGEEEGAVAAAKKQGIRLIREVARNPQGTPLVRSIFQIARDNSSTPLLAYVNADILLTPAFIQTVRQVLRQTENFLMVGRRWDLDVSLPLDFSTGWVEYLDILVMDNASLHPAGGSDYFVFPRNCFNKIPDLAIGRAGWDNWMIYEARRKGWPVVDATPTYKVIHQQHDYSHLPDGKPHYRHPESDENVRLAGGRHAIYTLMDANFLLKDERLVKAALTWKRFLREVEIFPLTVLKWPKGGWLSHVIFHPVRAYQRLRAWLSHMRRSKRQ
jgi:hypothetical protein